MIDVTTAVHIVTILGAVAGGVWALRSKLDELKEALLERIHGLEKRVVKLETRTERAARSARR